MATIAQTSIREASLDDQSQLAFLVHFDSYVHRHLDYRPPLDWLGNQPFYLLEESGNITAALACPADPPRVAWLRLFASSYQSSYRQTWDTLWPVALQRLSNDPAVEWAAAIPLHDWFESLLIKSRFQKTHSILMMEWVSQPVPPGILQLPVNLRPATLDDLAAIQEIDHTAFVPVWQNSIECLEYAYRQAALATVAELDGQLIGYQISTPSHLGGHLARLAVLPAFQGQGVGYALLGDLLNQFMRRGARQVTVNTQFDNRISQTLYHKAGFLPTGEVFPIYQLALR
jgi:ribosomal-protein-alanine N-acetyltransferase